MWPPLGWSRPGPGSSVSPEGLCHTLFFVSHLTSHREPVNHVVLLDRTCGLVSR